MRFWLAIRLFFQVLFHADLAHKAHELLDAVPAGPTTAETSKRQEARTRDTVVDTSPRRSEAVTLLATLQREARLVDIVKEPLAHYTDAQIGAAARDVLRDCGRVLDRLFELRPLVEQTEGAAVEVPAGYDTGRYRLTGNVAGSPPFRGRLVHHGWIATRCELPSWSGSPASQLVVAPQEVELE